MPDTPRTHPELIAAFEAVESEITSAVRPLSVKDLRKAPGTDSWNILQLLGHLVHSVRPVAKVLSTPKRVLVRSFGVPSDGSREFDVIRAVYHSEIEAGAVAAGPYLPDPTAGEAEVFEAWLAACADFRIGLADWQDENLDTHQVPHPLIGMLTMREMVMFSIYHCRHHFEEIRQIL